MWTETKIGQSKLVTHIGGTAATWEELQAIPTPEGSGTWQTVPHARVVEEVATTLEKTGLAVTESAFATYKGGARFFGLLGLDVKGGDGAYNVVVGLRNSHDKSFPVGMVVGSRVFVCDNLAFTSEIQVVRRHTKRVIDDLPRLIATACGMINDSAAIQEQRFNYYQTVAFTDQMAHDVLVQSLEIGAIGCTMLPKVLEQWKRPAHDEFADATAWRLWNGFTEVYKETPAAALPRRAIALQGLFDTYTRFQPAEDADDARFKALIAARKAEHPVVAA